MEDNWFGVVCKFTAVIWTALCIAGAATGLFRFFATPLEAELPLRTQESMRTFGLAMALGIEAVVWIIPLHGIAIFYYLFGRGEQ